MNESRIEGQLRCCPGAVEQGSSCGQVSSSSGSVLSPATQSRAWGRDPAMSDGGWVRRIQPFVIGTRLSAPPDPQDQVEPSWSPCPTGRAASDRSCSTGLEEEEEEEEDSLSPAYSSSRSIRKIAICRGGQPGPPDPREADPRTPDLRETSPGPLYPKDTSPPDPGPLDPREADPGTPDLREADPGTPDHGPPRDTRPLDPGPFDPKETGTPDPRDTRPPNPGPLDPRETDPGPHDPREPGRGGPRGVQASWEDQPRLRGWRRATVSAVEEELCPPEESRPLVAGSGVEEEEPQRETTSDHLLSSSSLIVKLALDVSSFYQTADGLLATMDSKHVAELTNKEELEELTLKITMLDQRVICLSEVHPTLASRLTQKQTEVRDRWHRLLERRSVEGASCLKPGYGADQSGLDVEYPAFTVKTLRWLEDSASLAPARRPGGVRTKRPFRKRRSLRRRIYQLLSRCAELCMDILEAQDLMVLRCEPHSPMMDAFTQQQHTLELEQEVMRPDVEELEHVTSDPQCEDMGACLQAWEEVTRGLAENNLCLQHVENIQRFLRDYLDIISWAEETRTALLSKGPPQSSVGRDHPGPQLEPPLDPPLHHLPEPPLHHPPAPEDHLDPVHRQDPVHHRVQQKLKDLSVLEAEGRLLFPESSHLAPTIKERMEELQGMLGWIQLNGWDRRSPGYHSNQLGDVGRQDGRSPSSEAPLPPHENLHTQSPVEPSADPNQVPQCLVTRLSSGGDGISLVLTFDPESADKGHDLMTPEPSHRVSRFLQVSDMSRGGPLPLDGLHYISSSTTTPSSTTSSASSTTTTSTPSSTTTNSTPSSTTITTTPSSSTTPSSTTTTSTPSSTTTTSTPSSTTSSASSTTTTSTTTNSTPSSTTITTNTSSSTSPSSTTTTSTPSSITTTSSPSSTTITTTSSSTTPSSTTTTSTPSSTTTTSTPSSTTITTTSSSTTPSTTASSTTLSSTITTSTPSTTTPSSTTITPYSTTSTPSTTTTSSTTFLPKVSTVVLPATPALTSVASLKVHTEGRGRRSTARRSPSGPPQAGPPAPAPPPHRANTWPLDHQTSDGPAATTRPGHPSLQLYMRQDPGGRTRGVKGPDRAEVRGHAEGRYTIPLGSTLRLDLPRSRDKPAKLTSEGHSLARTSPPLVRSGCLKTCLSGSAPGGPGTPQPPSRVTCGGTRPVGEMSEHVRAPANAPLSCHPVDTPHGSQSTEEPRSPPPLAEGASTPGWVPGVSVTSDQAPRPSSRAAAPEPPGPLELLRRHICPSVHTKISDLEGHMYYQPKQPAPLPLPPDQTGSVSARPSGFGRVVVCSEEEQTCWFCSGPGQRGDPRPQTAGGLSPERLPPERWQFEEVEGELEDIWDSVTIERAP